MINKRLAIASVLTVLFFGGLYLVVLEISLYRKTLISWIVPTGIWLSSGLITTPLTFDLLTKYFDTRSLFLKFVYNTAVFGGIIVYGFVGLNFYYAEGQGKVISVKILETGRLAKGTRGCGNPYARIHIKGQKKELIFPCDFEFEDQNSVDLTIKRGLLGFDVIVGQQVMKR